jgi:hypothetical protein
MTPAFLSGLNQFETGQLRGLVTQYSEKIEAVIA